MFSWNHGKRIGILWLISCAFAYLYAGTCVLAQSPRPLERTNEVVGDCLALLFLDPQQAESRPMQDIAAHAIDSGWAFRCVDTRQEMHVAQKWRIHTTPTFVLVRGGREVDRILGPVTWNELSRRMLKFSSPDSIKASPVVSGIRATSATNVDVESLVPMQPRRTTPSPSAQIPSAPASGTPQAATVRIVVDEPNSHAVGSGTIIHSTSQSALVLTCGHLFRDWSKQSVITVERFEQGAPVRYQADLIDYQIEDVDIGMLVIHPGKPVPCAKVASRVDSVREGDPVFSVGCDHGDVPSTRDSQVTKLNRYLGSSNIETSGLPVQGRSGGGLFNREGELIGVCFAADAELNEGLYCGTQCVVERLSKLGIRPSEPQHSIAESASANASAQETAPSAPAPRASTMTVIMTDSTGNTRQLTIDRPSEQLLDAMLEESKRNRLANGTNQIRWRLNTSAETR